MEDALIESNASNKQLSLTTEQLDRSAESAKNKTEKKKALVAILIIIIIMIIKLSISPNK
jgi:t-SNARE complex subunit (syntaxin)